MKFYYLIISAILLVTSSCFNKVQEELCVTSLPESSSPEEARKIPINPNIFRNGKVKDVAPLDFTYNYQTLQSQMIPTINADLIEGLKNQFNILKRRKRSSVFNAGNFQMNNDEMIAVVKLLLENKDAPELISQHLDSYLLNGEDNKGNFYMTGYFSPTIEADYTRSETYNYPIYRFPDNWENELPTREEIDGPMAILEPTNNEIAYAKNLEDIYFMQVQGSGYIKYPDGKTQYLRYDGNNKKRYRSIEQYMLRNDMVPKGGSVSIDGLKQFFKENPFMRDAILFQNPSYVFFEISNLKPTGSGGVPLTAKHSIAVDSDFIPVGSTLLASIPIYQDGRIVDHEYRILLAQDVGGAIRGSGHIDLYSGVGEKGQQAASQLHHYGKVWLLKPKAQT